jgi:hypothetical protein
MALHQSIQRLLLVGVKAESLPPPPTPHAPAALAPLIEAFSGEHRRFDSRAIHFGHRYRSGFWAIYLLSAIAVLFAIMPLALGWDSPTHQFHPLAGMWALGEVLVIGTVSTIYWLGHRNDWQSQWLRARTTAELIWYLPMLAPLIDFSETAGDANWYLRVFDPGQDVRAADDVAALCARNEPLARTALAAAWSDPEFVSSYAQWTMDILEQQRHYHFRVAHRQHALRHRVHLLNTILFGLTALGALTHLIVHTLWLSLVTTFFPALGASLHGALAQSEAYRLEVTSERLIVELQGVIDHILAALRNEQPTGDVAVLKSAIEEAISLILEEHQDWHLLVRPHNLPLA